MWPPGRRFGGRVALTRAECVSARTGNQEATKSTGKASGTPATNQWSALGRPTVGQRKRYRAWIVEKVNGCRCRSGVRHGFGRPDCDCR